MRANDGKVHGWHRLSVMGWTTIGTLMLMAGSAASAYFAFFGDAPAMQQKAVVAAMGLPIGIGAPVLYMMIQRLRVLSFRALRMQVRATRDGMTRFFNQTAFRKIVEAYLNQRRPGIRRRAALLVIDADHFKSINDTYGHAVGDDVIRTIANRMRSVLRRRDIVGRIGGEEFGVFLQDADERIAASVAERIRSAINLAEIGAGIDKKISVSVGGVLFEDEFEFGDIFKVADGKLYEAKAGGRNQVKLGVVSGDLAAAA